MIVTADKSSLHDLRAASFAPRENFDLPASKRPRKHPVCQFEFEGSFMLALAPIIDFLSRRSDGPLRIIDMGCLDARRVEEIRGRFPGKDIEAFCNDISISSLLSADFPPARIFNADLLNPGQMDSIPADSFDLITLANVFSGYEDEVRNNLDQTLFPALHRLLVPGGIAVLGLDYCDLSDKKSPASGKIDDLNVFRLRDPTWLIAKSSDRGLYQKLIDRSLMKFERDHQKKLTLVKKYFPNN